LAWNRLKSGREWTFLVSSVLPLATAGFVFIPGIDWGLPSRDIDPILFVA